MAEAARPLAGRVALISGAGRNIGRETALTLAADGAAVVVNGRADRAAIDAVAAEIVAAGGRAHAILADVSDPDAVAAMAQEAAAVFGGVDILVTNAGLRRQTPFLEMDFAEWREILSVALDGAFLMTRAIAPQMVARGGGRIVCLSGVSGHIGTRQRAHVNASKAGLEGLVRGLALELAPHGITVNAVAPGLVDTVRGTTAGPAPPSMATASLPLGRPASTAEIAGAVRYLVGPAGGYVTGQTLHVNGGLYLGH